MIENVRIKSTMLGIEDHGIMTFFLMVEWPGAGCGVGGFSLDCFRGKSRRAGDGHAYNSIRMILETLKIDSWEHLPGTYIRIVRSTGRVTKIGHIVEDRWFDLVEYFKEDQEPETESRNTWQPIETAPKDGTRILISDGWVLTVGKWQDRWVCSWDFNPFSNPHLWAPIPPLSQDWKTS